MRTVLLFSAGLAMLSASFPYVAQARSTTCATSVVCAEFINTSSGVAIHGEANSGIGIRGTSVSNTGFYGASGSGIAGSPGVEGESTNSTGSDAAGAFGLAYLTGNPAPAYGAIGYGSAYGLFGETANPGTSESSPGYGLFGKDGVTAASSQGDYNAGILGTSTFGAAVLAEANGTPNVSPPLGKYPVGVYSVADVNNATYPQIAIAFYGETNDLGMFLQNPTTFNTEAFLGQSSFITGYAGRGNFDIDYNGDMQLSGDLTTSKGIYARTVGATGTAMREYGARMTAPDVEDVGEAQLVNGRTYVAIDARLADTIDRRVAYHVFVTPEGDCNGLYITQKSPAGFAVRELHGGRSSLSFEYRIVAKPLGENGTRLEVMPPETRSKDVATGGSTPTRTPMSAPRSPDERMRQRLGPQGYAEAMKTVRKRLNAMR